MTALVGRAFAFTFVFARPVAAPRRNAQGNVVQAAVNVPRFDHDGQGNRRGLLIGPGALQGEHDAVSVQAGEWEVEGPATVLWAHDAGAGVVRRAFYTRAVRACANALLGLAGHHVSIGAVPGFLPNLGGKVRYRAADWSLGQTLTDEAGNSLVDDAGRELIESA